MILDIIILIICLGMSFFFSAAETAITSISKIRTEFLAEKKIKNAEILLHLKTNIDVTLSSLLIGNNIVNLTASAISASIGLKISQNIGIAVATAILTVVIIIFCEIIPKTIAAAKFENMALKVAHLVRILLIILKPIRTIISYITKGIFTSFKIKKTEITISEDEIKSIVNLSEEEGSIRPMEKELIHKVFQFNDIEVEDVMTPKRDVISFEGNLTLKQILPAIIKTQVSRFPIYDKDKENIIGMGHLKDVIKVIQEKPDMTLKEISKKAFFVPESKKIDELLKEFQQKKIHMAMIVDKYGVFTGIATIENILEELVGEIYDEQDEVIKQVNMIGKNTALIDGNTQIKKVNRKLKIMVKFDEHETISAFLLKKMGKIPEINDKLIYKNCEFIIKEMDNNRIKTIKCIRRRKK